MRKLKKQFYLLISVLPALLFMYSCANVVKPSGGEKDTKGPEVSYCLPANESLNFQGDNIDIYFDEYLKPGAYGKEIFISPVLMVKPIVTVKNKRLRIQFQEELRANTTYVITLGTEIKDYNESNKMATSYTYAFSTGDLLDSLSFSGKVQNAWTTEGQSEMKIFLFQADEIEANKILDQRPVYAVETDEDGNFNFRFLKEDRYKIYAIKDEDQSFTYSSDLEMIALKDTPLIDLSDTMQLRKQHTLYAFLPDKAAPRIKSGKWSNDHLIHIELSEPLRPPAYGGDTLAIAISDTNGQGRQTLKTLRYRFRSPTHLYIHIPQARSEAINLSLHNLTDTLGNTADSTLRIDPRMQWKGEDNAFFDAPIFVIKDQKVLLNAYFTLPGNLDTTQVHLLDSNEVAIDFDIKTKGLSMLITLLDTPAKQMPYKLVIDKGLKKGDGSRTDTTLIYKLTFPDVSQYGSVTGKIMSDSTDFNANWITLILGAEQQTAAATNTRGRGRGGKGGGVKILRKYWNTSEFDLKWMKAGKYAVKYIRDDDGNGYFTPGSLEPYRMPEKIVLDPVPMEIRAKWDVEGYNLFPTLPTGTRQRGKKRKK